MTPEMQLAQILSEPSKEKLAAHLESCSIEELENIVRSEMTKEAFAPPGMGNMMGNALRGVMKAPMARRAAVGAGVGAGLGVGSYAMSNDPNKSLMGSMAGGAALGAGVGAAAKPALGALAKASPAAAKTMRTSMGQAGKAAKPAAAAAKPTAKAAPAAAAAVPQRPIPAVGPGTATPSYGGAPSPAALPAPVPSAGGLTAQEIAMRLQRGRAPVTTVAPTSVSQAQMVQHNRMAAQPVRRAPIGPSTFTIKQAMAKMACELKKRKAAAR